MPFRAPRPGRRDRERDPSRRSRTAAAAANLFSLGEKRRSQILDLRFRQPARLHAPHGLPFEHIVKQFHQRQHEPDKALRRR